MKMKKKILKNGSIIYEPTQILHPKDIVIGKNCTIGQFSIIGPKDLTLEDNVEIAPYSLIGGGGKVVMKYASVLSFGAQLFPASVTLKCKYMNDNLKDQINEIRGSITIEEGVHIGPYIVICVSRKCPDIVIGKFSVIGALMYIDESIPPYSIVLPKKEYIIKPRIMP